MVSAKERLLASWQSQYSLDPRAIAAFEAVDRALFVPEKYRDRAYADYPLPIMAGQTISQPLTVMLMTSALGVREGMRVLEVGAGSGYQAAILAKMVGTRGSVISVERIPELVSLATENLRAAGIANVTVVYGDGSRGFAVHAPYERIIVTAAAPRVPPPLRAQLADGGILIVPVGASSGFGQTLVRITRHGRTCREEELGAFSFVPLVGKYGEKEK